MTLRALALPLLAATLCGSLRAAELGEVKVNSHIGQQLSADIELVDLTPADLADLQAKLANPDVFKGANLAMSPALGGLYISVARRENKRFLHLTTLQPVNSDVLHLFLELNSGGRPVIRAASLWLTPEPPAQRVARTAAMGAAAPMPMPVAAAAPAPAENSEAGLAEAARRAFEHRKQMAQAEAGKGGASPTTSPPPPDVAPAAAPSGTAAVPPSVSKPPVRKPRPQPVAPVVAEAAQACAPAKEVEAQLQQCQAMTSKLSDIEGKVQRLQTALVAPLPGAPVGKPAAVQAPAGAPQAAKPEAALVKPGAAPTKPGAAPVKPGVAADLAGKPRSRLMMIIGGVLAGVAVLGGVIYFLRKRRQSQGPLKIWQSFRKKGSTQAQEPVLDEVVEVAAQ